MPDSPRPLDSLLQFAPSGCAGAVVAVAIVVAWAVLHVVFAVGVHQDAGRRRTELAPAWAWTLATLLTGVLGAVAYWVVHRSTLAPPPPPPKA